VEQKQVEKKAPTCSNSKRNSSANNVLSVQQATSQFALAEHTDSLPREALLATCFTLVSPLSYSSTLKMEATSSLEMSVDFQRAYATLYSGK
jgi:hypothetical protein